MRTSRMVTTATDDHRAAALSILMAPGAYGKRVITDM